jgi:solute carrier family 25 (adenine nucleotide translocator) protein 4/5/6/31
MSLQALNFAFKDKFKEMFCRPAAEVGFWLFFLGNLAAGLYIYIYIYIYI